MIKEMMVICPHCSMVQLKEYDDSTAHVQWECSGCNEFALTKIDICLRSDISNKHESFRPKHYEKGHDTFAWAEHKFDLETNIAICQFNIHKYNDREKGQDKEDFEKIIVYAQRALDLIKEDKMEVTGL